MSNKLENMKISFTGQMKKDGIYEKAQEVIKLGATWDKDVSSETDILVKGEDYIEKPDELFFVKNSRLAHEHKVKQAEEFNTKIISEDEFYELINN